VYASTGKCTKETNQNVKKNIGKTDQFVNKCHQNKSVTQARLLPCYDLDDHHRGALVD